MIKINLLPSYVGEGRKSRRLLRLVVLVLLIELGACGYYFTSLNTTITQKTEELTTATNNANMVRALEPKVAAAKAAAIPVKAKLTWYNSLNTGFKKTAESLKYINDYIYAKLTVTSLSLSGNNVQLQTVTKGSATDLNNLATAYLNLLRSPYIETSTLQFNPSFSGSSGGGGSRTGGGGHAGGIGGGHAGRIGIGSGISGGHAGGIGGGSGISGGRAGGIGIGSGISGGRAGGLTGATGLRSTSGAYTANNPNESMGISFTFSLKSQYGQGGGAATAGGGAATGGRGGRGGMGGGPGGQRRGR